jgi:hypothetical protein
VFEQYNKDLVKESEDKVWLHPDAVEKNYYVNDAGPRSVCPGTWKTTSTSSSAPSSVRTTTSSRTGASG